MRYILALLSLTIFSCRPADDHGHSHAEDGDHAHAVEGVPVEEHTAWTGLTELFVEFPVLVAGETSRFAAHFTLLNGHQPVREGRVTVSLIRGDRGIRHTVETPSSPGIFAPALKPSEAGIYQLVFELQTPGFDDRIVFNDIRVFPSSAEAEKVLSGEDDGSVITFSKEQAWKMEFQTVPVSKKAIYQIIHTSGIWKVAPSDYQALVAPASGRVTFDRGALTDGAIVKKGQVLMTISSAGMTTNNLDAEIKKAEADYEQARSEYDRKKELFDSRIVSRAEFEQVARRFAVARANYEALSSGYSSGGVAVSAPMDGYLRSVQAVNGGYTEQGENLLTVSRQKSRLLQIQVSPKYSPELQTIGDLWYQPKPGVWSSLFEKGGSILSVGKVVEAEQPMISVFAEVNEVVEMPEGSFTEVQLSVGEPAERLVVPISSLMEDYGNYSVIVQLGGERFERRNVVIGNRNGSEVAIESGLELGEMIVTKGAYQVKMASMSGQIPAHGHTH
jgi:membrane fusion protein, heavy metal efflux system